MPTFETTFRVTRDVKVTFNADSRGEAEDALFGIDADELWNASSNSEFQYDTVSDEKDQIDDLTVSECDHENVAIVDTDQYRRTVTVSVRCDECDEDGSYEFDLDDGSTRSGIRWGS
jgi:hypothetical protein